MTLSSSGARHHEATPLEQLVTFGRALRQAGIPVGTERLLRFCRASAEVPPKEIYHAGAATLCSRPEHLPIYDKVFREVFAGHVEPARPFVREKPKLLMAPSEVEGKRVSVEGEPPATALASVEEVLRTKSFARCTAEELALIGRLMARIRLRPPTRRTRRRRPAPSGAPDLRRTMRRAARTGGEPIDRAWRTRRTRHRRIVLILDVSGSMAAYSRALILFAHAALRAHPDVEAFSFGTRLTRLTPALRAGAVDVALRHAAAVAPDWDGGTRIGASLKEFLDRFGHAGVARGAVVVIASDGLDVGDPELLATQMGRLHRLAHRVVWLNPLKEYGEYRPLARGMASALPSVDLFTSAHDLATLEDVARRIAAL